MQSDDLCIFKKLMNFEAMHSKFLGIKLPSIYLSNALYDHAMSQYLKLYKNLPLTAGAAPPKTIAANLVNYFFLFTCS